MQASLRIDVVTLFPEIFSGYLTQSLLAKAIDKGLIEIAVHDLRDWSTDEKHHKVDDRPYGGGPGMLICVEPVVRCVLGDEQSSWDDSFSRGNRILEFPQYTRPPEFRGASVPEVLLSGDHGKIAAWRAAQSERRTREIRSDLLDRS